MRFISWSTDHPWRVRQAVALGLCGIITVVAVMFLAEIFLAYRFSRPDFVALETLLQCLAVLLVAYIYLRLFDASDVTISFWSKVEWRWSKSKALLAFGAGLALSIFIRIALLRGFVPELFAVPQDKVLLGSVFLGSIVLQPLIEEVYFRGILFMALSSKIGPIISIIVVTLIFDAIHVRHQLVVLPISMLLGLLRICLRSTSSCFSCHVAYNLVMSL